MTFSHTTVQKVQAEAVLQISLLWCYVDIPTRLAAASPTKGQIFAEGCKHRAKYIFLERFLEGEDLE